MRIGIITFHWACNYGAVLQAFALQTYLKNKGYDTEIINYIPLRLKVIDILSKIKNKKMKEIIKEYKISTFRREELSISKRIYPSHNMLKKCNQYDTYICGSDQVWNEWFLLKSEKKENLSYYLDFVKGSKKRIAYAASFGTNELLEESKLLIKKELVKFDAIGVRENTGKLILNELGIMSSVVADPTFLIEKKMYIDLLNYKDVKHKYQLFSFILHNNQNTAEKIIDYISESYFSSNKDNIYKNEPITVIEWLYNIKNSKLILTNSFHAVVFSIIFHTPFIVIPVEASKMNDRVGTLLNSLDLHDRILETFDIDKINKLVKANIDWNEVDKIVESLREKSINFLDNAINFESW